MTPVLIVEDDPAVARSLTRLLRAWGFDAQAVDKGADALAFVASHPVAMVVLDLSIPDMSGVDVLRALRAPDGPAAPPPVVIFSATDNPPLREQAMRFGAIGFVSKSQPNELLPLLETYARQT
jgi:CheY-like chemotaxis protein